MRSGISEFSYGYAITEALVRDNGIPIIAAPVFPSLIEEGRTGGGYDLKLNRHGIPLFIQFKLSEYMKGRSNTPEIRNGLFSSGFYRMHLRPLRRSDQHNLLLDLESNGNDVFYVAPLFHELHELNEYYLSGQILQKSAFFYPSDIGSLPDDDEHHVSFQATGDAYFCSQPRQIAPANNFKQVASRIYNKLRNQTSNLELSLSILLDQLLNIIHNYNTDLFEQESLLSIRFLDNRLRQVDFIARTYLDCNLFIAQEKNY
jgi:hypothetical protein